MNIFRFKNVLSACAISLIASTAFAAPWKFGVMSDTQWPNSPDNKNPNVAVNVIRHLNTEFVNKGVKFVVQVGDLTDAPGTSNINLDVRATFAQDLYNAGIGFYPLRGNHESANTAATRFQQIFPQTQSCTNNQTPNMVATTIYGDLTSKLLYPNYNNTTFCIGSNFASESGYEGLSYAFDNDNARIVLVDTWTSPAGVAKTYMTQADVNWVGTELAKKPANGHAFTFAHKGLITENHYDNLFSATPDVAGATTGTAGIANSFMQKLADNGVRYHMGGHDHMHNRAIVTSPDGASKVQNIIASSNSYKFYIPAALGAWNSRETMLAQELFSVGYYVFTVDGPKVTVDHYAMPNGCNGDCDQTYDVIPYDTVPFTKHETFGYSLNGKEVIVAQNNSFALTDDTTKAVANGETGYLGTVAAILSGTNGSTGKDYNKRALTKSVNTGWTPAVTGHASDIFTLWGLQDSLATDLSDTSNTNQNYRYVDPDTNLTDTYVLSMSYDPSKVTAADRDSGNFGLTVRDEIHGWVNAVAKNFGGGPANFVMRAWQSGDTLGTYGVDATNNTAWAVINHASDFAVAPMATANIAPVVSITSPVSTDIIDAPANITITANATDADGTVAKVEFYNGTVKIGQATAAPFSMIWNGILTGNYTLKAIATDNEGLKAPSAPVSISVTNFDNVAPTAVLTAPADGTTVYTNCAIMLNATAADTDGFVTKVEFYNGSTKLGEATKAPYTFTIQYAVTGSYAFTAVATDNDGGKTTSPVANVTVNVPQPGGTISFFENFDSMGATGTTPPTGWSIKNANSGTTNSTWLNSIPANGANSVATMVNAAGALATVATPSTTNNNGFNAAGDNAANRMLATSPTSVAGAAIQLQLTNNSAGYINRINVGYDIYRFNAPASVNELPGYQLFYSTDNGYSWNNVVELNPTVSGPNGVVVPNTIGVTTVPKTLINLATPWNPGANLLLRWVDDNGVPTSPDQIYGLDNVTIETPQPLAVGVINSGLMYSRATAKYNGTIKLTNTTRSTISGKVSVSLNNLTPGVTLANASGNDFGIPYINQTLAQDLDPGASITIPVTFSNPTNTRIYFTPAAYGVTKTTPTQFVYTSDSHYGITRKDLVSSTATVTAQAVNQTLVAAINGLQTCNTVSDPCVGAIDFVANTGDVANRQETGKAADATTSWGQFSTDYLTGLTVTDRNNSKAALYLVPGNHDVSNAIGYYKGMTPLFDATSYVNIYNMMLRPVTALTNAGFIGTSPSATTAAASYAANKVRYSRDMGGVHFVFIGMWPDSDTRTWMDADLSTVKSTTPVVIFTHDEPNIETKHLMNPNGTHTINSTDKFENLVLGENGGYATATVTSGSSVPEQNALVAWLKNHKNVVAYFHGNTNYNEFYNYSGPNGDISLNTFRVDSPMKGMVSGIDATNGIGDPSKLSFQVISIDPNASRMTVREYLWNTKAWGASITVPLTPRIY